MVLRIFWRGVNWLKTCMAFLVMTTLAGSCVPWVLAKPDRTFARSLHFHVVKHSLEGGRASKPFDLALLCNLECQSQEIPVMLRACIFWAFLPHFHFWCLSTYQPQGLELIHLHRLRHCFLWSWSCLFSSQSLFAAGIMVVHPLSVDFWGLLGDQGAQRLCITFLKSTLS